MKSISSLRVRIVRSIAADSFGQILTVGIRLVLLPLFIKSWGVVGYSEWLTLTAFIAVLGLCDLGGQLYFVNRLTMEWTSGEFQKFQRTYSTGLLLFLALATCFFVCVIFTIPYLPIEHWLEIKSIEQPLINTIILILAFRLVCALPIGLLFGIYRAIGCQATGIMYGNLILLIQFITSALILIYDGGMLLMAIVETVPIILVCFLALFDLQRRLPNDINLYSVNLADPIIFKEAIKPSLQFLCLQLSDVMLIQGCVLVLAKMTGPVELAIFVSMRTLANLMARLMDIMSHAAWPELTRLASVSENDKLCKLTSAVFNVALIVGVFYVITLVNFGKTIFDLWLGGKLQYDFWTMYLLSCQVVVNVFWRFGGYLLMATNQHASYATLRLPINLLSLSLFALGANYYGLIGAIAWSILGQLLPMILITGSLLKYFGYARIKNHVFSYSLFSLGLLLSVLNIYSLLTIGIVCTVVYFYKKFLIQKNSIS